jgi:hypothetical protein
MGNLVLFGSRTPRFNKLSFHDPLEQVAVLHVVCSGKVLNILKVLQDKNLVLEVYL